MVCKKCGRNISEYSIVCPYCGVGQKTSNSDILNDIKKDLESLKIEENTSSFNHEKNINSEIINENKNIGNDIKVNDEVLDDIIEHKNLFTEDKDNNSSNLDYLFPTIDYSEKETPKINKNLFEDDNNNNNNYIEKDFNNNFETFNKKEKEEVKTKNNLNSYLTVIPIIIIILFIGLFILYKTTFSPKARFFKIIDSYYNNIDDLLTKINNHYSVMDEKDIISVSSNSTINETINGVTKERNVKTKYIENKIEERQYFEYNNDNSKNIFFIQNNKLYINQENSNDNFYITNNSKYINILNMLNKNNIEYIKNIIVENVKSEIKGSDFKTNEVEETYNKKSYKLKHINLELSRTKFNGILIKVLEAIRTDANAINYIENSSKYSINEIKDSIDKWIKDLNNSKSDDIEFRYHIYLDNDDNIIRQKIEYKDLDIEYWNVDNNININIKYKEDIYNINIKNSDNNIYINLKYNINEEISFQYSKQKENLIVNYQINNYIKNGDNTIQKSKIVNILSNSKNDNNKYINNVTINVKSNLNNEDISQNINMTNIIEAIDEMPSFDINNPNKIKTMSKEIQNKYNKYFSYFMK